MNNAPNSKNKTLTQELIALKKLWPYLRAQKRLVVVGIVLIPMIAIVEMYLPMSIKWAIDEGIAKNDWEKLKLGALFYLGLVLAQYISRSLQTLRIHDLALLVSYLRQCRRH